MRIRKILMARLDDELDQLTDKAIDKLMERTEDLDQLADLLLEKGLGKVDDIVDAVVKTITNKKKAEAESLDLTFRRKRREERRPPL